MSGVVVWVKDERGDISRARGSNVKIGRNMFVFFSSRSCSHKILIHIDHIYIYICIYMCQNLFACLD